MTVHWKPWELGIQVIQLRINVSLCFKNSIFKKLHFVIVIFEFKWTTESSIVERCPCIVLWLVFLWLLAMLFQHQKFKVWLGEHLFQCCLVLSPRFLSSGLKWCTINVLVSSGLHFLVHKFDPYIHTDFSIVLWSQIPLHPPTMSFDGPLSPCAFKAAYCTFSISKISILMRWAFATTLIGTLVVLHVSY